MSWEKRDRDWASQAVAVIDTFSAGWVRTVLARTTLHNPLRQDPAAVREAILDESRFPIARRRAAQQVLMAAGIFTEEPMEPVIFAWDRKGQPPLKEIFAITARISGERRPVIIRELDTGGDEYAIVVADRAVSDDDALAAWDNR